MLGASLRLQGQDAASTTQQGRLARAYIAETLLQWRDAAVMLLRQRHAPSGS